MAKRRGISPDLAGVWEHMRELGLGALAHANRHAAYHSFENNRWSELSVLQAAHAAELLIKARIAQEHPLLIFEQIPSSAKATGPRIDVIDLFTHGRTLEWQDLPDRLWAVTGSHLPNVERFRKFGRLRNGVQHFAPPPGQDVSEETLRFVFEVIDPFINSCWGLFAVDYDEDYDPYVYFVNALIRREIPFLVSPKAAATAKNWSVEWSKVRKSHRTELERRIRKALPGPSQRKLFG
jgi:hypothetical protein